MKHLESVRHQLMISELLGADAGHYGSPDELMLISAGPISHLSQFSLLCGPSTRRVTIRQPPEDVVKAARPHSPLSGETRLEERIPFTFQREIWNGFEWETERSILNASLASGLRAICSKSDSIFPGDIPPSIPYSGPFWAGALAYDLLQLTQPLRLQNPPKESELLCVLWEIERCIVHQKDDDSIVVLSTDTAWAQNVERCLQESPVEYPSTEIKPSKKPISNCTDEEHAEIVRKVHSAIVDGQLYQLNYGRSWEGEILSEPWDVFSHSVTSNPAPYSGFLHMNDEQFALVSASPESLLSTKDGVITTAPIKGTAPRGASVAEESLLREDMISDRKERAEHRMLVDLMRNDVGRISQPNQVWVERFDVEAYAEVQHLVSRIKGRLKEGVDVFDSIDNVFPGGSITGCPRTVVCAAIDELERKPRSFWTGSMGWFDPATDRSSWNILIRTAELRKHGSHWHSRVTAGGGITIESNPKSEVAEAKWKANALLRSCGWLEDATPSNPVKSLAIHPLPLENEQSNHEVSTSIRIESFKKNAVLLIDNLDSFTYNIAHSVCGLGHHVNIVSGRGQSQSSAQQLIDDLQPSHIILGPGPGWPQDSQLTMDFATLSLQGKTPPLLGICLGHQAIGLAAGLELIPSPIGPVHGTPVKCIHNGEGLFRDLNDVSMTRYNSLTLLTSHLKDHPTILVDATDDTKSLILGLHSKHANVFGVQFHPESVGSQSGGCILSNFLEY
jgi:anthranilate synthase